MYSCSQLLQTWYYILWPQCIYKLPQFQPVYENEFRWIGLILLSTVFFIYIYLDDWDNAEILLPFFLQVIWGVGSPEAIHRNAAMPPAFTLMFCGDSRIIGGSGKRKFYRDNKWCSHFQRCLHDTEKVSCTRIQFLINIIFCIVLVLLRLFIFF